MLQGPQIKIETYLAGQKNHYFLRIQTRWSLF
jgi:hypothetical protein